jgi:large subunit ribosomal protein L13
MRIESYSKLIQRRPEKIIEHAVKGMLPKGALGRKIYTNLKVYKGEKHPHDAQTPELLNL